MADERTTAPKPWWAPDSQVFVIAAVVVYVGIALFYRMTHPAEINDKLLDMMLTILFGTAFVGIVNYLIGSSRGSAAKDDTTNRIVEKLTSPNGPVAAALSPAPPTGWWARLSDAEKTALTASTDARVQAFVTASTAGNATADDLAYLVSKNLLTQERADAIQKV